MLEGDKFRGIALATGGIGESFNSIETSVARLEASGNSGSDCAQSLPAIASRSAAIRPARASAGSENTASGVTSRIVPSSKCASATS